MNQTKSSISKATVTKATTDMPTSISEAKALGAKRYYTGKPCPKGHVTHRYTAGGGCAQCISIRAKQKYDGGWRQDTTNRKQINARWNASTKGLAAKHRWRERNPKRAWCVSICAGMRDRAKAKGVLFDVSAAYLESITPDTCPVFGTAFSFINNVKMTSDSPSVDRLRPELGYVGGNIVVVSMRANAIKSAFTSAEVLKVAQWMEEQGL